METSARLDFETVTPSQNDFATTVARLKDAVAQESFSVLFELDLQAIAAKKELVLGPTVVLGICKAPLAVAALHQDPRILAQLPCRVGVSEHDGQVTLTVMNPKLLADLYEGETLSEIAKEVDDSLQAILKYASTRG